MSIKLAILIGLISISITLPAFASQCYQTSCGKRYDSESSANPCQTQDNGCQCANPACKMGNHCLSQSTCCEAFGNIGGM